MYLIAANEGFNLNGCDSLDEALRSARALLEGGHTVVSIAKLKDDVLADDAPLNGASQLS